MSRFTVFTGRKTLRPVSIVTQLQVAWTYEIGRRRSITYDNCICKRTDTLTLWMGYSSTALNTHTHDKSSKLSLFHSFHSFWMFPYSAFSNPLSTTQRHSQLQLWYCVGVYTLKRNRQLWVKDLPKIPTWRLKWDSNLRPSGGKATNLPLSHHAPQFFLIVLNTNWEITLKESQDKIVWSHNSSKLSLGK